MSLTKQEMRDVHIEFPKWIVWENVTGALSSNGGSDFGHVLDSLAHLGGPLEISVDGLPKFSAVEFGSNHETHTSRLPSVCRLAPTVMRSVLRCAMNSTTILRATTLLAAAASLAMSVWLYFQNDASIDDRLNGIFVGVWVPSILALGNFLITSDSDRKD